MAAVGDIYSCKVVCRATPAVGVVVISLNILHYRVSAIAGTGKGDQDIADAMDLNYAATYKAYLSADAAYRGVIVQKIRPLPLSLAVTSDIGAGPGTAVIGDLLPTQVCGMITKQTTGAGRAKRGRIYMPFLGEDDVTDSQPNVVYLARLAVTLPTFLNGVLVGAPPDTVQLLPVIFHRVPGTSDDLTSVVRRSYSVTQRRRSLVSGSDVDPFL